MKHVATAVLLASALTGCAISAPHECPLDDTGTGSCASMQTAYSAAQAPVRSGSTSLFEGKAVQAAAPGDPVKPAIGALSNYPVPDQAMPVFQQPKVFRPWLAPYVDADGVLHAGEYAYFSTPGQWNYGELRKPGAGGAVMGPAKPWDTGFVPREAGKTSATNTPPAPPAPTSPGAQTPAAPDSITQPYQRLN